MLIAEVKLLTTQNLGLNSHSSFALTKMGLWQRPVVWAYCIWKQR